MSTYNLELMRLYSFREMDIPKIFWKYYDLYRRGLLDLFQYAKSTNLPLDNIILYLKYI